MAAVPTPASMRRTARSLDHLHHLLVDAINRADLDAFVELHDRVAGGVMLLDGRTVHGHAEIRAAMTQLFHLQPAMTTTIIRRLDAADLTLTQRRWYLALTEHGGRADLSGRGTMVSKRGSDGLWRVVLDDPLTGL